MAKIIKIVLITIANIVFTTAVLLELFILLNNAIYSISIVSNTIIIISSLLNKINLFTRYLSLINI